MRSSRRAVDDVSVDYDDLRVPLRARTFSAISSSRKMCVRPAISIRMIDGPGSAEQLPCQPWSGVFGSPKHAVRIGRHVNTRPYPAGCHNWSTDGDDDSKPTRFGGAEYCNRLIVPIILREQRSFLDVHDTSKSYDLDPRPLTDAILAERRKKRKSYPPSPRNIIDAEQLKGLPVRLEYQQKRPEQHQ